MPKDNVMELFDLDMGKQLALGTHAHRASENSLPVDPRSHADQMGWNLSVLWSGISGTQALTCGWFERTSN